MDNIKIDLGADSKDQHHRHCIIREIVHDTYILGEITWYCQLVTCTCFMIFEGGFQHYQKCILSCCDKVL